ncbi:unnamed protein product [Ophioblennius macclurei]
MGMGQSKENLLQELSSQDYKAVKAENPDAVEPLEKWVTKYGFNGKLSIKGLTDLQQNIKQQNKNNEQNMEKDGYSCIKVWLKIADRRERGEQAAKRERAEKKKQEEKEREEKRKCEVREETVMFQRKEDTEYVGPYQEARQLLEEQGQREREARERQEQEEAPPEYSAAAFRTPNPPRLTRNKSEGVGDWSKNWGKRLEEALSPQRPKIVGGEVQTLPLIELPNPRAGQGNQEDVVRVYRTWTQEDVKKAVEGIPRPKEDPIESVNQMECLRRMYHLNGAEVQQIWMCLMGPDWFHVKGDFNPADNDGTPVKADSENLNRMVNAMTDRVKNKYRKRANYTEIGRCKQNDGESFDDYRVRMVKMFKAHSGLEESDLDESAYVQQLKNALHAGSRPEIKGWVEKHYIGMSGGTLAEYVNYALHAEKVVKTKKDKAKTPLFYHGSEEEEVYYQNASARGGGRGRDRSRDQGRGRGRGRGRVFGPRSEEGPRVCWSCGKPGHFARECRSKPREDLLPYIQMGNEAATVRSAQGTVKLARETQPLWIRDPQGKSCQMSVLLLPECPVNLLGRDALCQLQLAIQSTPEGLKVIRQKPEQVYVIQGRGCPNYYYTLDVPNQEPLKTGDKLLEEGISSVRHVEDKMSSERLHVTMRYTSQPDAKYKNELDKQTPAIVTATYLYSDTESRAAVAVQLKEPLERLFRMRYAPHVSLCKSKTTEWKDLGQMVLKGERATDWVATSVNTWYSDSTGLAKKALFWTMTVQSGVHLDKPDNL